MRVRIFESRLIAAVLTALWTLTAGLVLLVYQPGGPVDQLVGLASLVPIVISLCALRWPPTARGIRAFAGMVWLGLGSTLLLIPSIAGILSQLLAGGRQTLLPSSESAYPWVLALAGTSLYAGLGLAERTLGPRSPRAVRLRRAALIAVLFTAFSGSFFTSVAIANEVALRDRPSVASPFGPTRPNRQPPACNGAVRAGHTARISLSLSADVDGRSLGSVELSGIRSEGDLRWMAEVATSRNFGQFGAARVGDAAWVKRPGAPWERADAASLDDRTVDRRLMEVALSAGNRAVAEEHGLEFVEGAPARHCRVAVDGRTFAAAVPELAWFAPVPDVHRWRGQLDFWVFADSEIGQVSGALNGEAAGLGTNGIQGTVRLTITASDRDQVVVIEPPAT